jgi:hypothetical protein
MFIRTALAEECAAHFSELAKTERLKSVRALFQDRLYVGMVNETKGSYLILQAQDDALTIGFYTSGPFDLFGVKREGALQVCDDGSALRIIAIGREEKIAIKGLNLVVGDGGPKMSFTIGEAPELLQRLHGIGNRGLH